MTRMPLRAALWAVVPAVIVSTPLHAQTSVINDLKGKIFDAKMAQQTFAAGLRHCGELNGTNFYFQMRDRVLNLEEFHHSLDSLAQQGVFNPETKRPWNQEDADARWELVKREAASDVSTCALVASLPDLQKKLDELQPQAPTSPKQ
jgi:hypothetical protein